MVDLNNIEQIDDESQLNKMLNEAKDFDERRIIRKRLLAVKDIKSKERAKEIEEREKRREKEIEDRKSRKEEEKKQEIQRLEELAKTSTADRIENDAGKKRQEYIKEKAKAAEEEKKKNLEHFEEMAKGKTENSDEDKDKTESNSKSSTDSNKAKNLPSNSSSSKSTASSMNSAKPKNSSASAFALFQNKDKDAGGTGKATAVPTAAANNNPNSPQSIKDNLLKWCQMKTEGYPNVNIQNFSSSWADGMAFCALIHSAVPQTFDFRMLNPKNRKGNFELAFKVAEDKCDISPLLEVEDMLMMGNKPDWKCVFTYVQSIYRKLELEPKAKAMEAKKNEG